ncbi:NUDIX domain-containing protein [Agromyces mediolanus]|uniref:NUDIX hydrolase n=1 Tax=Agromyces mediolanus TaxID=41986 RepID=UPI0038387E0B
MDALNEQAPASTAPPEPPAAARAVLGAAATVVLLRDGELGLEVLLAERPHDRGSFRGAWVFPGGAVDDADAHGAAIDDVESARRAAVRETREEIGIDVDPDELVAFSHWVPPMIAQKRLVTTFFAARMPDGEIRPAPEELVAVAWIRPGEALARHAAGAMTLWPPTWVTLHGLAAEASADAALARFRRRELHRFAGRFDEAGTTILWQEDAAYLATDGDAASGIGTEGPRHRLVMTGLPWQYLAAF